MHQLFDDPNAADNFTYPESVMLSPSVPIAGTVTTQFDGWGYVYLFDAATGQELDTFAILEAMDPATPPGSATFTVHEVATDPTDPSLMYLSYYAGGLRALQINAPARPTRAPSARRGRRLPRPRGQ